MEYHDCYSASLTNLAIGRFVLPEDYVKNYTKVLMGGIWCMIKIAYRRNEDFEEERRGRNVKRNHPWDSPFKIIGKQLERVPTRSAVDFIGLPGFHHEPACDRG